MRLSPGYGAVGPATLGTERQFPQDGAVSVFRDEQCHTPIFK
jgi:hypothetical protein